MDDCLKIALPKGRMFSEMVSLLNARGHIFPEIEKSRSLSVISEDGRLEAFVVRSADVPAYVANGAVDIGVVGKDVLWEFEDLDSSIYELLDLGFSRCRLVIASLSGVIPDTPIWRVATKYPVITERVFQAKGRPVEIIKLYGSVELAPQVGLSDVIVDLVETGSTLKANGLEVIEEIGWSTARLVANRVSWKTKNFARTLVSEISQSIK